MRVMKLRHITQLTLRSLMIGVHLSCMKEEVARRLSPTLRAAYWDHQ